MTHYLRHHCRSQGTPSLFPSILTPGQLRRKKVASSQEVICEQRVRPSHRKVAGGAGVAVAAGETVPLGSGNAAGGAERDRKCWYACQLRMPAMTRSKRLRISGDQRSNVRVSPRHMRSAASWRRRSTTRCQSALSDETTEPQDVDDQPSNYNGPYKQHRTQEANVSALRLYTLALEPQTFGSDSFVFFKVSALRFQHFGE